MAWQMIDNNNISGADGDKNVEACINIQTITSFSTAPHYICCLNVKVWSLGTK